MLGHQHRVFCHTRGKALFLQYDNTSKREQADLLKSSNSSALRHLQWSGARLWTKFQHWRDKGLLRPLVTWHRLVSSCLSTTTVDMQKREGSSPKRRRLSVDGNDTESNSVPQGSGGSQEEPSEIDAQGSPTQSSTHKKWTHCRWWKGMEDRCSDADKLGLCNNIAFSVMTYNILSQTLLEDNAYLYRHCSRNVLEWAYRYPNLIQEIEQFNADVLCLQEVQEDHYINQLKPHLIKLGYSCHYKMRTGNKNDGCAICFKKSRFSLQSWHAVEYYRPGVALMDRDNVGTIALLKLLPAEGTYKSSSAPPSVCVANTHLLFNPRRGDIKLAQLALLLAEIDKVSDGGRLPVLLCGDFNSVPGSPLYHFLRHGYLHYHGLPAWKVSGQQEVYQTNLRVLQSPLWPRALGVSPLCQYVDESRPQAAQRTQPFRLPELEKQPSLLPSPSTIATELVEQTAALAVVGNQLKAAPLENTPHGSLPASKSGLPSQTNFSPSSPFPKAIQHSMSFNSVYTHFVPEENLMEATICTSDTGITVDYIFYTCPQSPPFADQPWRESGSRWPGLGWRLRPISRFTLLTSPQIWKHKGLPNEAAPSDHLPLLAKFVLEF